MTDVVPVSRERFHDELERFADDEPPLAAFLTIPVDGPADYYLYESSGAGYAITDDDELVALFNHEQPSGVGEELLVDAIGRGADNLFCFDTWLTDLYERHGFTETGRAGWDEEMAPDDWDYDRFGRPDVVWMELER